MSFAPSTIAFSFSNATSRGRYFIPQSGATTMSFDATKGRARRMRAATFSGVSTVISLRSITPRMMVLPGRVFSTEQSRLDCAVSIETWLQLQPASSPRNERSEEHTSELQSRLHLVCRLLLEKKKKTNQDHYDREQSNRKPKTRVDSVNMHVSY